jgi:acyl-coenzyme A synthetase/AMP-(fatty) acid ligase
MRRTMEAFRGEWYVSGDMVSRDADGVFTYAGRADDMLKVSGKWLSPREVESCLLEHPAVEEVAVVGVPGESGLTVPRACVVRRNDPASSGDLARSSERGSARGSSPTNTRVKSCSWRPFPALTSARSTAPR